MIILRGAHSGFRQSYKNEASSFPAEYKYLSTNCRCSQPTRLPPQDNDRQVVPALLNLLPSQVLLLVALVAAAAAEGPIRDYDHDEFRLPRTSLSGCGYRARFGFQTVTRLRRYDHKYSLIVNFPSFQDPYESHRSRESYGSYESEEPKYTYSYKVKDYYGNDYGHEEKRDGDLTEGFYYNHLPDGRLQKIKYVVDGYSGYVADVSYEGEAHYDSGSYESHGYNRPSYQSGSHESGESRFSFGSGGSGESRFSSRSRESRESDESRFSFGSRGSDESRFNSRSRESRESGESRFGSDESNESRFNSGSRESRESDESRFGSDESNESRFNSRSRESRESGESRFGFSRRGSDESRFNSRSRESGESRFGFSRRGSDESRFDSGSSDSDESRYRFGSGRSGESKSRKDSKEFRRSGSDHGSDDGFFLDRYRPQIHYSPAYGRSVTRQPVAVLRILPVVTKPRLMSAAL
ncbi:hypothetical protein O3P69_016114 [Scylla paramamosain]|uniref:Uncharacterized protein n=1 Tax=Scylla paramamosain TaxID=85552 RepID=A0AAW0T9I8_SCYPA